METFTLWLVADDSDAMNGCMRVVPGSHRVRRVLDHRVDNEYGTTLPLLLDEIDISKTVEVELRAGEYSVHDPFILPGSSLNTSARRRCGVTVKYIPTYVNIDRGSHSVTGFDWANIQIYFARGRPGNNTYAN